MDGPHVILEGDLFRKKNQVLDETTYDRSPEATRVVPSRASRPAHARLTPEEHFYVGIHRDVDTTSVSENDNQEPGSLEYPLSLTAPDSRRASTFESPVITWWQISLRISFK